MNAASAPVPIYCVRRCTQPARLLHSVSKFPLKPLSYVWRGADLPMTSHWQWKPPTSVSMAVKVCSKRTLKTDHSMRFALRARGSYLFRLSKNLKHP